MAKLLQSKINFYAYKVEENLMDIEDVPGNYYEAVKAIIDPKK